MIKKNLVKQIVKEKYNKKIGKGGLDKVEEIMLKHLFDLVEKVSKRADLSGRKLINAEDFE